MKTMNENDTQDEIHFCNTCKYSHVPMTQSPCNKCVPGIFGGTDRWEKDDADKN